MAIFAVVWTFGLKSTGALLAEREPATSFSSGGGGRGIRTLDPDLTRSKRLAGARTRPLCDPSASWGLVHYAIRLSNQQTMKSLRSRS